MAVALRATCSPALRFAAGRVIALRADELLVCWRAWRLWWRATRISPLGASPRERTARERHIPPPRGVQLLPKEIPTTANNAPPLHQQLLCPASTRSDFFRSRHRSTRWIACVAWLERQRRGLGCLSVDSLDSLQCRFGERPVLKIIKDRYGSDAGIYDLPDCRHPRSRSRSHAGSIGWRSRSWVVPGAVLQCVVTAPGRGRHSRVWWRRRESNSRPKAP